MINFEITLLHFIIGPYFEIKSCIGLCKTNIILNSTDPKTRDNVRRVDFIEAKH